MPSIFADTNLAVFPRRLDAHILLLRFLWGSLFPPQLPPFWGQKTCRFRQYASCPSLPFHPTACNVTFFSFLLCPRQMSLQEILEAPRDLHLIPKFRGLCTYSIGTRMVAICVLPYAFLRLKMDASCKSCNLSCSVKAV